MVGVQGAVNAVVFLFLHRKIRPQDLLHRIARRLRDFIVGRKGHRLLHVTRCPAEVRDAVRRFRNAYAFLRRNLIQCQTCRHFLLL